MKGKFKLKIAFLVYIYLNLKSYFSPVKDTVVVNDRWGAGDICHHGDYYTCDDRYSPGKLLNHKWENCMTLVKIIKKY